MRLTCGKCDNGWICEEHPDLSWPHDDCGGPGVPCENLCLSKSRNEDTALRLEACNHHVSPQRTPHDALEVANIGSHLR